MATPKKPRKFSWQKNDTETTPATPPPDETQDFLSEELENIFQSHNETEKPPAENNPNPAPVENPPAETPPGETAPPPVKQGPQMQQANDEISQAIAELISPELVISFADAIFCRLFIFVADKAGYIYDAENIKLNSEDKRLLAPSVKNYLRTLQFNLTPLQAMLLSFGIAYSSKLADARPSAKAKKAARDANKKLKDTTPNVNIRPEQVVTTGSPKKGRGRPRKDSGTIKLKIG